MRKTCFVDWRVKSFEPEARAAFTFLSDQGFTVAVQPAADVQRGPATIAVQFQSQEATVETSLVLGFAGEDCVHTSLLTTSGSSEFGPTVAHKGHEMRKALEAHAEAVRAALASL